MNDFSSSYAEIGGRLARRAAQCGRPPETVRFMAVSKTQPQSAVIEALGAGCRLFGENRVAEAAEKFTPLRETYGDIELHLIGPLQTNKVRQAVALFDVIETLDRPSLAEALAKERVRGTRLPCLYVEVNIGREPQKAGIDPSETVDFVEKCRSEWGLPIEGLMAIPPYDQPPEPFFRQMADLAHAAQTPVLSMGMSGDFEEAIAAGSTLVRVGTALFGARKLPQQTC